MLRHQKTTESETAGNNNNQCLFRKQHRTRDGPSRGHPESGVRLRAETHVVSIQYMRLPKFVNNLVRGDQPAFLYAYHNGQQTYASNDSWCVPQSFPLPLLSLPFTGSTLSACKEMKEATTNPTPHMLGPRERTLVPADEVRQNSFSNQNWTVLDSLGHALFDESDRHEFHLASIELVLVGRSGE